MPPSRPQLVTTQQPRRRRQPLRLRGIEAAFVPVTAVAAWENAVPILADAEWMQNGG